MPGVRNLGATLTLGGFERRSLWYTFLRVAAQFRYAPDWQLPVISSSCPEAPAAAQRELAAQNGGPTLSAPGGRSGAARKFNFSFASLRILVRVSAANF